ncbi:ATP synthase subunit I [Alicyclobacillus kakegawensis]|uniref:ATP synthase subunit I n=1 Tax=Alicyclobacillus kakegawensis TaxID=392012 RepID=UPI000B13CFC9|nr:ATP synthase subunit I [Alicyclobacillus kakegawensis]
MNDMQQLDARIRWIAYVGAAGLLLTAAVWAVALPWRSVMNGLLLGEAGGAYAVYSMIRYGHRHGGLEGKALFASGMLGMFTRLAVLAAVMVAAVKLPHVNPYAALVGYLLGFVLVFAGLYGYARNRGETPREK